MNRVGIMLDWSIMQRALHGKSTYERLSYYVDIGKELALEPVFFHPRHVNLAKKRIRGHFWNGRKLVPTTVPIPKVIHNRVLSGDANTQKVIQVLSRTRKVFNQIVVRDKGKVHQMLWDNYWVRPFLPKTAVYTHSAFTELLSESPILYVKPTIGSVGVGVARIERQGNKYLFISDVQKTVLSKRLLREEVAKWIGNRRFLVQQAIPLATYDGETFDMRVSVQKNGEQKWVVSGMVAKVANARNKLSNLARGGYAVPIDQVFAKLFTADKIDQVKMQLTNAAIEIAKQYEKHFPSLADLGLDMGVDESGNPYLIEINVRDQRYSFFKAGEMEMFKQTYRNPLEYANSLYEKIT